MNTVKFILLGQAIALVIETITWIRIGKITRDDAFFSLIAVLMGWIWVCLFAGWVYHIMGLDYYDIRKPYGFVAWRLRRDK